MDFFEQLSARTRELLQKRRERRESRQDRRELARQERDLQQELGSVDETVRQIESLPPVQGPQQTRDLRQFPSLRAFGRVPTITPLEIPEEKPFQDFPREQRQAVGFARALNIREDSLLPVEEPRQPFQRLVEGAETAREVAGSFRDVRQERRNRNQIDRLIKRFGGLTGPVRTEQQLEDAFTRRFGGPRPVGLLERGQARRQELSAKERVGQRLSELGVDVTQLEGFTPAETQPLTRTELETAQEKASRRQAKNFFLRRNTRDFAGQTLSNITEVIREEAPGIASELPVFVAQSFQNIGLNLADLGSPNAERRERAKKFIGKGFENVARFAAEATLVPSIRFGESVLQAIYQPIFGKEYFEEIMGIGGKTQEKLFGRDLRSFQKTAEVVRTTLREQGLDPVDAWWLAAIAGAVDFGLDGPSLGATGLLTNAGKRKLLKLIAKEIKDVINITDELDMRVLLRDRLNLPEQTIDTIAKELAEAKTAKEVRSIVGEGLAIHNDVPEELRGIFKRRQERINEGFEQSKEAKVIAEAERKNSKRLAEKQEAPEIKSPNPDAEMTKTGKKAVKDRNKKTQDLEAQTKPKPDVSPEIKPTKQLIPNTIWQAAKTNFAKFRAAIDPEFKDLQLKHGGALTGQELIEDAAQVYTGDNAAKVAKELELGQTNKYKKVANDAKGRMDKGFRDGQLYRETQRVLNLQQANILTKIRDKGIAVTDMTNVEAQQTLRFGRIKNAQYYIEDQFQNLASGIRMYAKRNGFKPKEVYEDIWKAAYYTHVPDFNKQKALEATRRAELEDYAKRNNLSETELDTLLKEVDEQMDDLGQANFAGVTDEFAARKLQEFSEKYGDSVILNQYVGRIQELNRSALDVLEYGGMVKPDVAKLLREVYPNYVPLLRNVDLEDPQILTQIAFMPSALKRAKGSTKEVQDVLESSFFNVNQSVARVFHNDYHRSIAKFAEDNAKPSGRNGEFIVNENLRDQIEGVFFFDQVVVKTLPDGQKVTVNIPGKLADNEIGFFDKGVKKVIRFADRDTKMMYQGSLGRAPFQHKFWGKVLGAAKGFNRYYGSFVTRFNPNFATPNKLRDLADAFLVSSAESNKTFSTASEYIKQIPSAHKTTFQFMNGVDNANTRLYKEFLEDGGTIGGLGLMTRADAGTTFKQAFKNETNAVRRNAYKVAGFADSVNEFAEHSSRFLTYKAMRKKYGREAAATLAQDSSVNFNRFGEIGPVANALYLFFNASIQGTANMFKIMRDPKAASFANAIMFAAVQAQDRVNDNIDPEWKSGVPDYIRATNLVFLIGKKENGDLEYIKIPIPYSLVPVQTFWSEVDDAVEGRKSFYEAFVNTSTELLKSINPLGQGPAEQVISPTIGDIPVSLGFNRNWFGAKVAGTKVAGVPRFETIKKGFGDTEAEQAAIWLSKQLWNGTGINIAPEHIFHAYDSYLAGGLDAVKEAAQTIYDTANGEPLNVDDLPVFGTFYDTRTVKQQEGQKRAEERGKLLDLVTSIPLSQRKDPEYVPQTIRQWIIDTGEDYTTAKHIIEQNNDIRLPSVRQDWTKTQDSNAFQFVQTLNDMLNDDDSEVVKKANDYLQSVPKARQDSFLRYRGFLELDLPADNQAKAFEDYQQYLIDNGVELSKRRSTEIKRFETYQAAVTREAKGLSNMNTLMNTRLDELENGVEITQEQVNGIVNAMDRLYSEGAITTEQYAKFAGDFISARELDQIKSLVDALKNGTADYESEILPQLEKLTEESQARFWELVGSSRNFAKQAIQGED